MATDMGRGIMAPDTGDTISTSGVTEMRTIGATAALAIGDVDIRRGTMPPSSNADTFQTTGIWYTGGTETVGSHTNLAVKEPSDFFVIASNPPHSVTQFQVPSVPSDTKVYCRSKTNSATWSAWRPLGFTFGPLEYDTNMDSFYTPGNWTTGDATRTASITNLATSAASNLIVLGSGTGSAAYSSQIQIPVTADTGFYFRSRQNSSTWKPWVNLAAGGGGSELPLDSGHYGTPNMQRLEDFKATYPLVTTGNKGTVSFRWDHGLTKFKQHILPLHQSLNLPAIIAMNSRNWADAQNSGMTQAEARTLAQAGLIEWGNHTADHQDKGNMADMFDNIVNGRLELESQLGVPIWHFVIPGASPTGLGGLVNGPNLDVFTQTYAGSLVLAYHAVTTGAFSGTAHRKLDGRVKQGQNHYTMESRTVAEVKAQIDLAVTNKSSLWLMMHPNNINESGYLSAANVQEIMQYVKTKIDAGQLANITPNQSMHAKL